jgi:hypothetical protein
VSALLHSPLNKVDKGPGLFRATSICRKAFAKKSRATMFVHDSLSAHGFRAMRAKAGCGVIRIRPRASAAN